VDLTARLVAAGYAYSAEGDVYFAARTASLWGDGLGFRYRIKAHVLMFRGCTV